MKRPKFYKTFSVLQWEKNREFKTTVFLGFSPTDKLEFPPFMVLKEEIGQTVTRMDFIIPENDERFSGLSTKELESELKKRWKFDFS